MVTAKECDLKIKVVVDVGRRSGEPGRMGVPRGDAFRKIMATRKG